MAEENQEQPEMSRPGRPALWRRVLRGALRWTMRIVLLLALVAGGVAVYWWWNRPVPTPPTLIYQGVMYECRQMPVTAESSGLAHLVSIDLGTPGLDLYVTPVDADARAAGWEYVTRWPASVAKEEGLAVVINACMFGTKSHRLPGDYARGVETMVSNGEVNHVWEHTYLLWFEADLTPHLDLKPPRAESLMKAKWAIGGQGITYEKGEASYWASDVPDRRTFVGISGEKKMLYLGVFDRVSEKLGARTVAGLGASEVIRMDNGTSTSLVIGQDARGIKPGTYVYPMRGIATFFGVRAPPLK